MFLALAFYSKSNGDSEDQIWGICSHIDMILTQDFLQVYWLASKHLCYWFYEFGMGKEKPIGHHSGKDGKPDSWFLFDSYKHKRNPVTKVQEPVPEMSHISPQTYKILHKNA